MEFKLNEDQQMIHDLAKDFAESVLQPRIDEIEAGEMTEVSNGEKHPQLPHDIHQQLAECGFIGISFPEEYNGLGMGHVEQAIVIKELSRISPPWASAWTCTSWAWKLWTCMLPPSRRRSIWLPAAAVSRPFPSLSPSPTPVLTPRC